MVVVMPLTTRMAHQLELVLEVVNELIAKPTPTRRLWEEFPAGAKARLQAGSTTEEAPLMGPHGRADPAGRCVEHRELEWQRSFASATLRGVGRDARHVVRHLLRRYRG